jgi:predicted dehydrogenase
MIERLRADGRVHVSAVYDVDDAKRRGAAAHYDLDPELPGPDAVTAASDVDVVLVLTSMNEHGALAKAALGAGKHVLVEKPMATSLGEAAELLEFAETSAGLLVCAPHILLSPTFRAVHGAVRDGRIGELLTARARYGWAGPWWGTWFYEPGGGSLFDLGVYTLWWAHFCLGRPDSVSATGELAPTGVDADARVVLGWGEEVSASSFTSMNVDLPITAMAAGSNGMKLEVEPFVGPGGFRIGRADGGNAYWEDETGMRWRDGLCYQATAVAQHVADGLLEAPEHPLDATLDILGIVDLARTQLGAA